MTSVSDDKWVVALIRRRYRRWVPARIRWRILFFLVGTPVLAPVWIRFRPNLRAHRLDSSTVLLISGYPRSANSYARIAFEVANPEHANHLSSHLHSPWATKKAIHLGVPVILLIRRPLEAVASLVQADPSLPLDAALRLYLRFYRDLFDIRGDVEVVSFDDAVGDFASVISRCNSRYGTRFRTRSVREISDSDLFARVDAMVSSVHKHDFEFVVSRPSEARLTPEGVFLNEGPTTRELLGEAEELYTAFLK